MFFDNRYISANRSQNRPSKKEFVAHAGEMYPEKLHLHVLPDVSLHECRWFLVGPVASVWERSVLYSRMFSSMLDFAARSWEISRATKIEVHKDESCNSSE